MSGLIKQKRSPQGGLVLVRRVNESITLFDRTNGAFVPIVIKIAKIAGNRVSLHINASAHIGIIRTELIAKEVCDDAQTDGVVGRLLDSMARASGSTRPMNHGMEK